MTKNHRAKQLTAEMRKDISEIVKTISEQTNIPAQDIMGKCRDGEFVNARHLCWFFCVRHARIPVTMVANYFNVNHSAVIYGIRGIPYRLLLDPTRDLKASMDRVAVELKCEHLGELCEVTN